MGRSRSGAGRSPQRDVGRTMGSLSRVVPWVERIKGDNADAKLQPCIKSKNR